MTGINKKRFAVRKRLGISSEQLDRLLESRLEHARRQFRVEFARTVSTLESGNFERAADRAQKVEARIGHLKRQIDTLG